MDQILQRGWKTPPSALPGQKNPVLLGLRLSLRGNDSSTISDRLTYCTLSHKKLETSYQGTPSPPKKKMPSKDKIGKVFTKKKDKLIMHKDLLDEKNPILRSDVYLIVAPIFIHHWRGGGGGVSPSMAIPDF